MTFYSKLLENILSDSIPAKMGKIGWMEKLVSNPHFKWGFIWNPSGVLY